MKYKIALFTIIFALCVSMPIAWGQSGILTSTETQRVGNLVGATTTDAGVVQRHINFVGMARTENNHLVERLAIGIQDVTPSVGGYAGEGKASWSFLSLAEAQQVSKVLQRMYTLARRNKNDDIADKRLSFNTPSGFSVDYQETQSGPLLTISAGENGDRRCDFTNMDHIRFAKVCIDDGIDWIKNRPSKLPVPKTPLHKGIAYIPQPGSQEREGIMDALRKPFLTTFKKRVIFKVYHLKVSEGYAYLGAQALDAQGKPVSDLAVMEGGTQALLQKHDGRWKVLEWGNYTDTELEEECQRKYRKAPLAIYP
jgi:hypothetical protein